MNSIDIISGNKKRLAIILLILLTGIIYWNYTGIFFEESADSENSIFGNYNLKSFFGGSQNKEEFIVERVIDGDTIVLNNLEKVRMLGINTPERNMFLYDEAKIFLEELTLNKTIFLKIGERDRYGRILGYVFIENKNVNELILRNGLGNLYYYGTDEYYSEMQKSEEIARNEQKGIWEKSSNYGCLEIVEWIWLDVSEDDSEELVLRNGCDVDLDLVIKDDATHIYREEIKASGEFTLETKDIWNDNGDSLYIWDYEGLVLFERY